MILRRMTKRAVGLVVLLALVAEACGTSCPEIRKQRDELFARVWGTRLRPGDRSVDVYVHKLRVKLEEALPGWRFIHTHVGFGYRLSAEHSHPFHKAATAR